MNRPFWSFRSLPPTLCDSIEPLLSVYADGMASSAEARRIEAHLPECQGCRAALSWMQATRTVLASRPVAVPPPDLHSRIALAIAASSPAPISLRPARVFTVRTAYAAAASVTVLGAILSYGLLHTPPEVAVKHPAKPAVVATVPPPAVKPHPVPKMSTRPLVAFNSAPSAAVKHAPIARKAVPIAVMPQEQTASNVVPSKLPAVPTIITKALVHHALPTQKIASANFAPTEHHSIEKHLPPPVMKAIAPKLPETLKVAKIIKEPVPRPLDILTPKITPDAPTVQTASAHGPVPLKSNMYLSEVVAHIERMKKVTPAAISVPAQRSFHEATSVIQEVGNTDQTAILSAVHGNQ